MVAVAWRSRAKATAAAVAAAAPDEAALDHGELYDLRPFAQRSTLPVPGCFEAIVSASWDDPVTGWPVYVHGPANKRLGSIAVEGSPVLAQRPELFRPLRVPVDFPAPPSE